MSRTGARVEFHGQGAGLGFVAKGGDTSSAADHILYCQCNVELGPLARFPEDGEGRRAVTCPICEHVVVVSKEGQIQRVLPIDAIPGLREKFDRAKVGHAAIMAAQARRH